MLTKPITYAYALFIISSILLILSSPAYAEKIDPDTVAFEDMLAGGFAEETLVFHVDSRDPIPVRLSSAGPIREWIQFNQTRVMASAAAPLRLRLTIKPPDDALLGSHQGMVLIEKYSQGNLAATAVSMFSAVKIEVRIIDKEIVEGEVISTMAADAEQGQPVDITAVIRNNGNIAISPRVQVRISDLSGNLLFNNTIEKEIMPTATGTADLLVPPSNLAPGQYRADVTVSLNNMFLRQESSLFNIFSPNSSRRAGRLLDIQSDMRIPVNATTTIIPYFENIGNEAVSAFFIGDVYVNKKRIRQVTGLPLTVLPGEVRGLSVGFIPAREGRYEIRGHVRYNRKITLTKSAVFDAVQSLDAGAVPLQASQMLWVLALLSLPFFAAHAYYRMKRRRDKNERKV